MVSKRRTQTPPSYTDYSSYKKYLRLEFEHRCAYCEIHEAEDGGSKKFHIDHYLPKSKFPEKCCDYSNLFYSCASCNVQKGNYWANILQRAFQKYILNPCDYDYDIHYDRSKSEWVANTSAAAWNIEKLRLNSPQLIFVRDSRTLFLKNIEELSHKKEMYESTLLKNNLNESDLRLVKLEIEELNRQINLYKFKTTTPLD